MYLGWEHFLRPRYGRGLGLGGDAGRVTHRVSLSAPMSGLLEGMSTDERGQSCTQNPPQSSHTHFTYEQGAPGPRTGTRGRTEGVVAEARLGRDGAGRRVSIHSRTIHNDSDARGGGSLQEP